MKALLICSILAVVTAASPPMGPGPARVDQGPRVVPLGPLDPKLPHHMGPGPVKPYGNPAGVIPLGPNPPKSGSSQKQPLGPGPSRPGKPVSSHDVPRAPLGPGPAQPLKPVGSNDSPLPFGPGPSVPKNPLSNNTPSKTPLGPGPSVPKHSSGSNDVPLPMGPGPVSQNNPKSQPLKPSSQFTGNRLTVGITLSEIITNNKYYDGSSVQTCKLSCMVNARICVVGTKSDGSPAKCNQVYTITNLYDMSKTSSFQFLPGQEYGNFVNPTTIATTDTWQGDYLSVELYLKGFFGTEYIVGQFDLKIENVYPYQSQGPEVAYGTPSGTGAQLQYKYFVTCTDSSSGLPAHCCAINNDYGNFQCSGDVRECYVNGHFEECPNGGFHNPGHTTTPPPSQNPCSGKPNEDIPDNSPPFYGCADHYFACVNGQAHKQSCPSNTFWNEDTLTCVERSAVKACNSVADPDNQCVEKGLPIGRFPDPRQKLCTKYYIICANQGDGKQTFDYECPEPYIFDPSTTNCNYKENVQACQ